MAILSNINGKFAVENTGAIKFSNQTGTSGQILKSNGNAAPTWVAASTVIGGPYLPLSGGTLTGATATASGISFTVGGVLTGQANSNTFGTASASGRALIVQSGSSNQAIMLKNNLGGDGTISATGTATTMNYSFGTYSVAPALFIQNDGKVGIGTDSPGTKLTVNQTKSGTGIENYDLIELGLLGTGAVGDSSTIGWFSTSGVKTAGIEGISGLDNILYGELAFHVRRYTTDSYDRVMTINNRGNVGIGTTSPNTLLHINKPTAGDAMLTIQSTSAGDPGITMITTNNRTGNIFYKDGAAASTQRKFTYDHAAQAFKMFAHNTTVLDFYVSETEAYFPTQNVGIGITTPTNYTSSKWSCIRFCCSFWSRTK